jgi:DNA polymerase
MAVPGEGGARAKFMMIGEAPGRQEDLTGRPFVGSAGKYLDSVLRGAGLNRDDFFITSTVKCRPPANRTPKSVEIETCVTNYLFKQIERISPALIVLLGGVALKRLLGLGNIEAARGRVIEQQGRRYLVTYHPASQFYRRDLAEKIESDFSLLKMEISRALSTIPASPFPKAV